MSTLVKDTQNNCWKLSTSPYKITGTNTVSFNLDTENTFVDADVDIEVKVDPGSATGPSSLSESSASVTTGTNTITLTKTGVTTTPTVSAGYVSSATASTATVALTASVATQGATTYHPSTTDQTIASDTYTTGAQTIKGVTVSNLSAENIKKDVVVKIGDSADDDCVTSVTGSYEGGGGGGDTPVIDEWVRPSTWPDLDSIQMANDFEGLYLTYDLSQFTVANPWIGFLLKFVDSSSTATVERGHLSNGTFVADATYTASHNTVFRQNLDETNGTIQLWRIYTSGKITNFQFKSRTSPSNSSLNQACVEITGQLNNLVEITSSSNPTSTSGSSYSWGTYFLQRDSRKCGGTVTSLAYAWYYCYALQSLDVSKWNTTNWTVTSLYYCWNSCYSLQSLDLSNWNTTNWEVTTLSYCWRYCYSLRILNVSTWNTANWEVTTLAYCWYGCYSLQSLDLSNWNTTDWEVTDLSYCWYNCYALQSLDVSKWNTTNWTVTTLSSCWYNCCSLRALDLTKWNTTNWALTNLSSCWYNCCSLRALDLSKWKTTNWALTTINSCWYYCYSLNKLDVSGWSISGTINISGWLYNCNCFDTLKGFNDWTSLTSVTSSFINTSWICLKNCDGFPLSVNHSYTYSRFLTHDSLVSILNALPTVETSTTITLGSVNLTKLTDAEIAIATAKGWTVA